ncbi:glycosyltransferase [Calidifontibacter sp. DB0510]|uniref:Glycosyltransferase n=1 Tax=Metallococcus carri TaxID=1656884 RepID=A0A967EDE9_9MICO|nr:glycosyltransferase [Metallococcus carri]NHN54661.1 glycosyltransferase [Metallococcus carri]NOP37006.1 glycosyltransferase [Calidifontibacter sp. DB2511S]
MRILMWHVHGSWTTSFVAGAHDVVLPLAPGRGPEGRGRARTWTWPDRVREVPIDQLRSEELDLVVLQRPEEVQWCAKWTGRRPGRDLPAVYVEHNAPDGPAVTTVHPIAADPATARIPIVHVTWFNAMAWDNGDRQVEVIEHGVADPGIAYTGRDRSLAVVVNEPMRRWRTVGTDLLVAVARELPVHVYGMAMAPLGDHARAHGIPQLAERLHDDLPQAAMHAALADHRAYLHTPRWTSLGLSLIEAMLIGLPVLALATTEAPTAVPPGAGLVTNDLDRLRDQARIWLADPDAARAAGAVGRAHALRHYGLERFLTDWDALLKEMAR